MIDRAASTRLIKSWLNQIGYNDSKIEECYEYQAGTAVKKADFVAFADEYRKDLLSSCIAVNFCDSDTEVINSISNLRYLATPIAILPMRSEVLFLSLRADERASAQFRSSYSDVEGYLQKNRLSFVPETVRAAKMEGRQLSLFELDPNLFSFASKVSQRQLVNRFENAVNRVTNQKTGIGLEETVKLAIKILTAKILEDKNILGTDKALNAESLIQKAGFRFKNYFNSVELLKLSSESNLILDELGRDVTYKMITNEDLGYFFENTFVNALQRKSLGIYYTPQKIATSMLSCLPIEEIDPNERVVLDGTCGSGSLLTAAYLRMYSLLPKTMAEKAKHDYLTERIYGIDSDPFATEVAKKSLLLASLPFGNSWKITPGDFLKSSLDLKIKPTIIVANPPFLETRTNFLSQAATIFLDKYLDMLANGGLISIVLPEPFLQNKSCRASRQKLLSMLDIIEMWQLPEGAFPMAQFATVVINGRKDTSKENKLIRVRRLLRKQEVECPPSNRISFDFNYTTESNPAWQSTEISFSNFEKIWDKLNLFPKLADQFHIRNGINVGNSGENDVSQVRSDEYCHKFIDSTDLISPYKLSWANFPKYLRYPGCIERPRKNLKSIFEGKGKKALVNANRAPGNPWRMYATVDREGIFPNHGFYLIWSKKEGISPPIEVVAAVLNSYVANAYMDSFNRKRWLVKKKISDIPMPIMTQVVVNQIVDLVHELESRFDVEKVVEIDNLLFNAYGLTRSDVTMIKSHLDRFARPGLEFNNGGLCHVEGDDAGQSVWRVAGRVIDVDPISETVLLHLLQDAEPTRIPIPDCFPGWALRNNVSFEALIPNCDRNKPTNEKNFLVITQLTSAFLHREDSGPLSTPCAEGRDQ